MFYQRIGVNLTNIYGVLVFSQKVIQTTFLFLHFKFFLVDKRIGRKAGHKMLVKLTKAFLLRGKLKFN
jgi:hypothetical protein